MVWPPVFGIFNVRIDVDACDCTRGRYGHRQRVFTGSWLWGQIPLPHRGLEPASVLRLAFRSDALPTEVFPLVPFISINFVVIVFIYINFASILSSPGRRHVKGCTDMTYLIIVSHIPALFDVTDTGPETERKTVFYFAFVLAGSVMLCIFTSSSP